jgi:hypothetical protein
VKIPIPKTLLEPEERGLGYDVFCSGDMFKQLSPFFPIRMVKSENLLEHYFSHSCTSFSSRWNTDTQSSVALVNGDASHYHLKLLE